MFEIEQTDRFAEWFERLRDVRANARIRARLDRVARGHFGDVRNLKDGVSELRIDFGPGYRIYFTRRGAVVIILLCGGDKSTQSRDIAEAKALAAHLEE